jgi:poly-gamma-glutamate synthesis protein (capsule biosynthesis protein)
VPKSASAPASAAPAERRTGTSLYFLGDVYLPSPVRLESELPAPLVYNLEAPLTRATHGWPRTVNLRCEEDHTLATFGERPLAVCLANNHIMDFGAEGLAETVARLDGAGVAHFGAGPAESNCGNPLLLTVSDTSVALLGYVCPTAHPVFAVEGAHPGVAPITLERIRRDVEEARARGAACVVVCLHWGIEELDIPRPADIQLAHAVAEVGVDLVVGHHAHCIQPFEVHAGVPIFYGLGNAIFPDVECWSEYDDAGNPGERYRKRQNYWNRPSLAVEYDVVTGAFRVDRWYCDGRTLRMTHRDVTEPSLRPMPPGRYEAAFRRRHFQSVWRNKFVNYVRSPKLPRARHLRSLANIFREAHGRE